MNNIDMFITMYTVTVHLHNNYDMGVWEGERGNVCVVAGIAVGNRGGHLRAISSSPIGGSQPKESLKF